MIPVPADNVIPVPATKLSTPVLFTVKPASGPTSVNAVMLMPSPAVGVIVVMTDLPSSVNAVEASSSSNTIAAVGSTLCGIDIMPSKTSMFDPTCKTPGSPKDPSGNRYDIYFP